MTVLYCTSVAIIACGGPETDQEIRIGALFDLTGPTSDVAVHYADGVRDYFNYVNEEKGGIGGGVKLNLIWTDYQYRIPQAISAYAKFVKQDKVSAIIGFGTGDSEALKTKIVQDEIPYISASLSQHLVWPPKWNFLPVTTYADHVRTVMKYMKDNWDKPGNPRMGLIYNDSGYGRAPIEPARQYAKELGIDLVAEEIVGLQDLEATAQLLRIKQKEVDFVFIQETYTAASTVLKDAKKLNMSHVKFIGNCWTTGKKVAELAGDAAEGFLGIMPFALWSDDSEGVRFAKQLNAKYHPNRTYRDPQYLAGMLNAMIVVRAAEIALEKVGGDPTKVTGSEMFEGFESIKDFDTRGLSSLVSYGPDERRGAKQCKIVKIDKGELVAATTDLQVPQVPEWEMMSEK